jgi:hypothetical protein
VSAHVDYLAVTRWRKSGVVSLAVVAVAPLQAFSNLEHSGLAGLRAAVASIRW